MIPTSGRRNSTALLLAAGFVLLLLALLGAGCGGRSTALRVGAKSFAEQRILAEVAVQILRADGMNVEPVVNCGDTYACQRMMQDGDLDVMIEYSGTGLSFLGAEVEDRSATLARARELYAPLGLQWQGPLGFDNGYRILAKTERAASLQIATISDLEKIPAGVKIACPREFVRRPRDGLGALIQRYGLRLAAEPVIIDDVNQRLRALVDGRVDAAVGYATDGAIVGLGVMLLDDPLTFFPPYEAAYVVRSNTAKQLPEVEKKLGALLGALDVGAMQKLNYRVEVEGRTPAEVAREFLKERGLISADSSGSTRQPELVFSVSSHDRLGSLEASAIRAMGTSFAGRSLRRLPARDPIAKLADGTARLAILGAERFFHDQGDRPSRRETRVEAVAVVGNRMLHLVTRSDVEGANLSGRVGVMPRGSGGQRVADRVLDRRPPVTFAEPDVLLNQVADGSLDVALILASPGDPTLSKALAGSNLRLQPLDGWWSPGRAVQVPFLRPARIPARTYPNQEGAVDTVGLQVVLAAPAHGSAATIAGGGPASALPQRGRPLTTSEVEALAKATGVHQAPDAVLPSAWKPDVKRGESSSSKAIWNTVLNIFAIAFLVWLATLFRRREATADRRRLTADG